MGLPLGMQPDFGRFDPKFLGVTLKVGSQRAHEVLREAKDVTPAQVESAPEDQAFETLALLTALVHETRHFHDFLLAPFGGLVARQRFTAFLNAKQVLNALLSTRARPKGNVLPVPFRSWCVIDPEARREEAGYWKLGKGDQVIPLPDIADLEVPGKTEWRPITPEFFPTYVVLALRQYRDLDRTFSSYGPYEMSEASALLMQAQEIWRAFGETSAELFLRVLRENPKNPYGRALWLLFELMAALGSEAHAKRMSEVVTWTVLGDVFVEGTKAGSLQRFSMLAKHLLTHGYPEESGIVELFALWDAATGSSSTIDGIKSALWWDDNFAEQLERAQTQNPQVELLGELMAMFEMLRKARRTTVEQFLASPEDYVYPERYQENIASYINPPVVIEFEGGVLEVPEGDPLYTIVKGREGKDGRRYAMVAALPHDPNGPAAIDLQSAVRLRDEIAVAEVLFSAAAPDPVDWEICKEQFEHYGLLIRQVIN